MHSRTRARTQELSDAIHQLRGARRVSRSSSSAKKPSRYIGACATSGLLAGVAFAAVAGLEGLVVGSSLGVLVGLGIGRLLEWDERRRDDRAAAASLMIAPERANADTTDNGWQALMTPPPARVE